MIFTLDYAEPELLIGQKVVLRHQWTDEYALGRVHEILSNGCDVAILHMKGTAHGKAGQAAAPGLFMKIDELGNSIECWTNAGFRLQCINEYAMYGNDVVVPDDLAFNDAIDYVIQAVTGSTP